MIPSSVTIVCHDWTYGPPHALRDFLLDRKISTLLFIGHRNRYIADNPVKTSYFELYRNGELADSGKATEFPLPEFIGYVRDFMLTLLWTQRYARRSDMFIGVGNLNAYAGLLLQMFGITRNVIYYVIDLIPDRFGNAFLDGMYLNLDRLCALRSDSTWNYSSAMIKMREDRWQRKFPGQQVVPNGVRIRDRVSPEADITNPELVYIGSLYERQGLQLPIRALPLIAGKFPGVRLTVIGQGPYRVQLEKLATELNQKRRVRFLGYIADQDAADECLSGGVLGIATYMPGGGIAEHTDPGKVKRYLALGIPVVMTDVSFLAAEIRKNRCGFVIGYDPRDFARAVTRFLTDAKMRETYRSNALKYAGKFAWDTVFSRAFRSMGT